MQDKSATTTIRIVHTAHTVATLVTIATIHLAGSSMSFEPVEKFEAPIGAEIIGGGCCLHLDTSIYPVDLVMRTAYWFTDRVYIYLTWATVDKRILSVSFRQKNDEIELNTQAYAFLNSLLDQAVRKQVEVETHEIREIIIKKAFSEALSTKDRAITQRYGD